MRTFARAALAAMSLALAAPAAAQYTIPGDPGSQEWVDFWKNPPDWAEQAFPFLGDPDGPSLLLPRTIIDPPERKWGDVGPMLDWYDGLVMTSRGAWFMDIGSFDGGGTYDRGNWTNPSKTDGVGYYGAKTPGGVLVPYPPTSKPFVRLNPHAEDAFGIVWSLIQEHSAKWYPYVETAPNGVGGWDYQICDEGAGASPFACNN